jgi:hypothetical protein
MAKKKESQDKIKAAELSNYIWQLSESRTVREALEHAAKVVAVHGLIADTPYGRQTWKEALRN